MLANQFRDFFLRDEFVVPQGISKIRIMELTTFCRFFGLRLGDDFRSGRIKAKRFIVQETSMDAILRIGRQTFV